MFWPKLQKIALLVFILSIVSSLLGFQLFADNFSLDQFKLAIGKFGLWTPFVFTTLYTIGTIFIPSTPFMALAGLLFGFKLGILYTFIGSILSSIITYWIAGKLGREKIDKVLEHRYLERLGRYNQRLERGAILDLVIMRIMPIMPFNVLNVLMGLSRIKFKEYVFGTILGLIPSILLSVYFGSIASLIF